MSIKELIKIEKKLLEANNHYVKDISNLGVEILLIDPNFTKGERMTKETINWLKVAESAFEFWNNEVDEVWNSL